MRRGIIYGIVGLLALSSGPASAQAVDFIREVRPILAEHCFKCHGPDDQQRQAGLRLDERPAALAKLPSGKRAILPGKPDQSELIRRIHARGPGLMPPAHANKPLSEAKKQILRRWIADGADYRPHWAFVPPKAVPLPPVKQKTWPRNPIDVFTLARMEKAGLRPSPEADRYTLIRRLSLDLIGLPPTPEETDAFVNDQSPNAYEKVVDRLLASPHYGERWARRWLDLARYADTNGYEKDRPRSIWPYRDWVIQALNADMPFDQFTIEQLAGDMLPNATLNQRIATGFHRNTMLNEEGGIDPLEFRFHAMTDRVAVTGTTWLGLTIGCAQCHTHKYDPITQKEYYQTMAFLNNADEPEIELPKPDITAKRRAMEAEIAQLEASLPKRFPLPSAITWTPRSPSTAASVSGAALETQPDGSIRTRGAATETDTYTVTLDGGPEAVSRVRLEALTDPALGNGGPGRTPHGNFVLTEFTATVTLPDAPDRAVPLKFVQAEADFAQEGFPAASAIDGDAKTGWAIHGPGKWNVNRVIQFTLEKPVTLPAGARWTFRLEQNYGGQHTLGRFRLSLGAEPPPDPRPEALRRKEALETAFAAWKQAQEARAVRWTPLRPRTATSQIPLLTILNDGSVLASGDQTKRDVYDLRFPTDLRGITAIRLEALTDERLPKHGPGRIAYEGPPGDFFLSEITLAASGKSVKFAKASHSYASGGNTAEAAIDGDPQTGWSINGGQGRTHTAVFNLAEPLNAGELAISLLFERYYAAGLGRFRISVTTDPRPAEAGPPPDVETILLTPEAERTEAQKERLFRHFLMVTPELAEERDKIRQQRDRLPAYPTTLVMAERPPHYPRPTFVHHRGEFLQAKEKVEPATPRVLPPLPPGAARNRLTFARWLVDPRHPLTGRVIVNRQWAAFFGRGLVPTLEDFGVQGQPPTHPELLDWLAIRFAQGDRGQATDVGKKNQTGTRPPTPNTAWSLKALHRLIVTSATYRQSSVVTPALMTKDPQNQLLARGPRVRLEAELLRDQALAASGLLSRKLGGPSVFPPQPPGVTSEGTYGPLEWKVSPGEDGYRRGLYTFSKRTAPYAMFATFDAPSGEAICPRREVSNTPLQALTLLNDQVFVEAAQALGAQTAALPGSSEDRAVALFRRCLTRPPEPEERRLLLQFYATQKARFAAGKLDATKFTGEGQDDRNERAAWTALARSLLNLDEFVVKR